MPRNQRKPPPTPAQLEERAAYMRDYRARASGRHVVRFNVCCQSADAHRPGCQEVAR